MDHLEQFKNHHFEKCWIKLVAEIDCQIQRWCWKVRSGVRTGFKSRPLFQNDAQRGLMIETFILDFWSKIMNDWLFLIVEYILFRRTGWCSGRSQEETTKGSDSTGLNLATHPLARLILSLLLTTYQFVFNIFAAATSTTLARPSLWSTLLASMVSGNKWHWASYTNSFQSSNSKEEIWWKFLWIEKKLTLLRILVGDLTTSPLLTWLFPSININIPLYNINIFKGSWRVTTSPLEVRTLPWLPPMLPASPRSKIRIFFKVYLYVHSLHLYFTSIESKIGNFLVKMFFFIFVFTGITEFFFKLY